MSSPEDHPCAEQTDEPRIFRIGEIGGTESSTRREFVKGTLKAAGAAVLLSHMTSCEESELDVEVKNGACTCHVVDAMNPPCTCQTVCSCHSVSICVCNMICTCNTVGGVTEGSTRDCPAYCSCVGHCSCNTQGGGGVRIYWYPC